VTVCAIGLRHVSRLELVCRREWSYDCVGCRTACVSSRSRCWRALIECRCRDSQRVSAARRLCLRDAAIDRGFASTPRLWVIVWLCLSSPHLHTTDDATRTARARLCDVVVGGVAGCVASLHAHTSRLPLAQLQSRVAGVGDRVVSAAMVVRSLAAGGLLPRPLAAVAVQLLPVLCARDAAEVLRVTVGASALAHAAGAATALPLTEARRQLLAIVYSNIEHAAPLYARLLAV
jgi:hypothetical protein